MTLRKEEYPSITVKIASVLGHPESSQFTVSRKIAILAQLDKLDRQTGNSNCRWPGKIIVALHGWLESALPFQKVRENPTLSLLRRELEYRHGECGMRQFIAILQLIENHTWEALLAAIERCVHRRVFHEQAVLLELQTHGTSIENSAQSFAGLDLSDRPELAQCGPGLRTLSIYDAPLPNEQTSFAESMGGEPTVGSFDTSSNEDNVHHFESVTNYAC